jgi:putrescine aminotransferase
MKKAAGKKTMSKDDLFKQAERVFSKGLVEMIKENGHDFLEDRREGSSVYDISGKRYLDCYTSGGMFNLGRRNPLVAQRFKREMHTTDQGNFVMLSEEKALLARKIAEFVPGNLECVLFGVTRGESMEAACKLARGYTARPELISVDGGCYGETGFALTLSAREGKGQFGELIPDVKTIPFGDIEAARDALGTRTAALVMEPIQAENHCRQADEGYYAQIRTLCDQHGIKLIFDETQSGFGRTGRKFFFEHTGVVPDILIVGEAITSGMFPMTAMVFTPELKRFFDIHPLIHLCTFGGHDLGCRVALATIDEYERQTPWVNAERLGDKLLRDFLALKKKHPDIISSVSGKGLMVSLKMSSQETARVFCSKAGKGGLLVETGRVDPATILIRPSLLIGEDEAGEIVRIVSLTLTGMKKSRKK